VGRRGVRITPKFSCKRPPRAQRGRAIVTCNFLLGDAAWNSLRQLARPRASPPKLTIASSTHNRLCFRHKRAPRRQHVAGTTPGPSSTGSLFGATPSPGKARSGLSRSPRALQARQRAQPSAPRTRRPLPAAAAAQPPWRSPAPAPPSLTPASTTLQGGYFLSSALRFGPAQAADHDAGNRRGREARRPADLLQRDDGCAETFAFGTTPSRRPPLRSTPSTTSPRHRSPPRARPLPSPAERRRDVFLTRRASGRHWLAPRSHGFCS
jgi:hypothetical protein